MTSWLIGMRAMRSSSASKRASSSAAGAHSIARPHSTASRPAEQSPVKQQPLRLLEADPVRPQRRRRHAPHARRRIADLRLVLDHQQIGAQRHVGAAGDAEAVDLADDRLVGVKQAHEAAHVAAHHLVVDRSGPTAGPGRGCAAIASGIERRARGASVVAARPTALHALGDCDEVVAAAEARAVAGERDDVDLRVEVGALDARRRARAASRA